MMPSKINSDDDTLSLVDILFVLAKNIRLILLTAVIAVTVTIIYVLFFTSPVYMTQAKLLPLDSGIQIGNLGGLAAQFGVALPRQSEQEIFPVEMYPEILKSRTLLNALLERKFDTEEYGEQVPLLAILTYGNEEPDYGLDTLMLTAVEYLTQMISLNRSRTTSILTLEVRGPEPQFVVDLSEAIIEEMTQLYRQFTLQRTRDKIIFIEGRIREVEHELMVYEDRLREFRVSNRGYSSSPTLQLEHERLNRDVEVRTGVLIGLKQQYETAKIEEAQNTNLVKVLDPPEMPIYRESPRRTKAVILAGMIGIGLGLILSFIKEYLMLETKREKDKLHGLKSLIKTEVMGLLLWKKQNTSKTC